MMQPPGNAAAAACRRSRCRQRPPPPVDRRTDRPRRQVADGRHLLPLVASPGTPPFVEVGATVKEGDTLCIIEAMKLLNEIDADASGVVTARSWSRTASRSNSASRCSSSDDDGPGAPGHAGAPVRCRFSSPLTLTLPTCLKKSSLPIVAKSRCVSSALAAKWASRPSSSIPRPTREAKYVKLADESVCIGPAASVAELSEHAGHHQRGRSDRRRGDPSRATASCRRTPISPSASRNPASSSSARVRNRSA